MEKPETATDRPKLFSAKNRKTNLKNGQTRRTENPNAVLVTERAISVHNSDTNAFCNNTSGSVLTAHSALDTLEMKRHASENHHVKYDLKR